MSLTREWLKATVAGAKKEHDELATLVRADADRLGYVARDARFERVEALSGLVVAAERLLALTPEPTPMDLDRALVDRLLEKGSGLTEWEEGFVESIDRWLREKKIPLTGPQRARAEQIDA